MGWTPPLQVAGRDAVQREVGRGGSAVVFLAVDQLISREPAALVARLPRRPGQKEIRYAHLLSGEVSFDTPDPVAVARAPADADRIGALEEALGELRNEVADLRNQLAEFRKQFE